MDWNGVPRVIHGGWMRSWKGGGREREREGKRGSRMQSVCTGVRRDEKCTDSTFKSIRRRMLSLDGERRVHSAQWVSTPKETRVGRKKVSSGRLPLLIGREFLDTYSDSSFASLVTSPPLYPMYFVNVVHPRVAFLNFVRFECSFRACFV